jgi:dienelactone hydrolase
MWIRQVRNICVGAAILGCASTAVPAQSAAPVAPVPGWNDVTIRGERQDLYYLPAQGTSLHRKVVFLPGDGGWKGWAITVGETMASWGYDVYGLDTKTYLDTFTKRGRLTDANVASDLCTIVNWTSGGPGGRVSLVGWSEGAGLSVLAAAGSDGKKALAGLVTLGLPDENVITWHWSDNLESFVKKPREQTFHASDYIAKVAPLPLAMIESSNDEYVGVAESQRLFAAAADPKRFDLVQAENHRFDGNHREFFLKLQEELRWVGQAH